MPKLLVKIGKDLSSSKWNILLANHLRNFSISCEDGFPATVPFPGTSLDKEEIEKLIRFLKQTLVEKEAHEQSNLE